MPYDLKDQIVHLVDTEAPPIDVSALAHQLAQTGSDSSDMPVTTLRPEVRTRWHRNRAFAFACAFVGVIVAIGAALATGVWINQPGGGDVAGSVAPDAVAGSGVEVWWIVLAVVTIGVGAFAFLRRRPTAGEEPVMQTIERTETGTDPQTEHLTNQRRGLVIALAIVLVAAVVAIGWLLAENRSLNEDLDAAVAELADNELGTAEQAKVDMMESYFATLTAGSAEGLAEFHENTTSVTYQDTTYDLAGWQAFLATYTSSGDWEWSVFNTTVLETGQVVTTFLMANPSRAEFYPHVAVLKFGPNGRIAVIDTFAI